MSSPAGGMGDIETVGWNIGASVAAQGFSMTGSTMTEKLWESYYSVAVEDSVSIAMLWVVVKLTTMASTCRRLTPSTALPRSAVATVSPVKMLIR